MERVPVIAVTYNSAGHLDAWLESITSFDKEVVDAFPVIVDNGSWEDNTVRALTNAVNDGRLQSQNLHWLPENVGHSAALGLAVKKIAREQVRYVVTLDPDATARPHWLGTLIKAAQEAEASSSEERVGMYAGLIVCPDDATTISSAGHCLRGRDGAFLDVDWGKKVDEASYSRQQGFQPFCPCFAAAVWSLEMLKDIGLPDIRQFRYYNDVELGYRARLRGWSCRFVPQAFALHPLPRKSVVKDVQDIQKRGRLAIVAKYFPEPERSAILSLEQADVERLKVPQEVFESNERRREVYDYWRDRHVG